MITRDGGFRGKIRLFKRGESFVSIARASGMFHASRRASVTTLAALETRAREAAKRRSGPHRIRKKKILFVFFSQKVSLNFSFLNYVFLPIAGF